MGVKTHALRDAGGNGGYVKLVGKLESGSFEACGDGAPDTASSWRNEISKRSMAACMLNHGLGPRKTLRTSNANKV